MTLVPTQVRIDEELKKQADELFMQLGLDMSTAVNIFLQQCILRGGLPFQVVLPDYQTEALEEVKRIREDIDTKKYLNLMEVLKDNNL